VPLLHHPPEEIDVAACGTEFWKKDRVHPVEYLALEQHVAGPAFMPGHDETGFVLRAFAKSPADDPCRRRLIEVRAHRSEHSGDTWTLQR
jgi:hypothetical protein